MSDKRSYRAIWRWHFYAGLFVLPFVLILSVTGSIYLFKPQIDRWEERAYRGLGTADLVSADAQLAAALSAHPRASFDHYRLPERVGDSAMIRLTSRDGIQRDVYVSPQGKVLGAISPEARISDTVSRAHGALLLGTWGDWLVELAASWTMVMIVTGLFLWWPRPFRLAGTVWPRLSLRGRPLLKDVHRVLGVWIAGLVLMMLASGLPWAASWGSLFQAARTELGLVDNPPAWKIQESREHANHDSAAAAGATDAPAAMRRAAAPASLPLSTFVAKAQAEGMAFPVLVLPPHAPQQFGPRTGNVWTAKSETQNRPLQRQVTYDPVTGSELSRSGFADKHVIDRVVNTGIAWHEGQLFGLANQLLGLATALALIAICVIGVVMWLKRRPAGELAAPPAGGSLSTALIAALLVAALLLPLFGASLLLILVADRLLFSRRRAAAG